MTKRLHDRLPEIVRQYHNGLPPSGGNVIWLLEEVIKERARTEVLEPLIDRVLSCDGSMIGAVVPHSLMRELKAARDA